MDLIAVAKELAVNAERIPDLAGKSYHWPNLAVNPPAFIVGAPDELDMQGAYQVGMQEVELDVYVLIGRGEWNRDATEEVYSYCSGSGPKSIKAALDTTPSRVYSSCDIVVVTRMVADTITAEGVQHPAARFTIEITGSGND